MSYQNIAMIGSSLSVQPTFSPLDISGLRCWYDASDASTVTDSAGVVQWADKSGLGHHLNVVGSAKPTTGASTLNGLNVLDFSSDALFASSVSISTRRSVFMVWQPVWGTVAVALEHGVNTNSNKGALAFFQETASGVITDVVHAIDTSSVQHSVVQFSSAYTSGVASLLSSFNDETHASHITERNGGSAGTDLYATGERKDDVPATDVVANLYLGGRAGTAFFATMKVAELIIYNGVVSGIDLSNVEDYLLTKWGL